MRVLRLAGHVLRDWRALATVAFLALGFSLVTALAGLHAQDRQTAAVKAQSERNTQEIIDRQVASCQGNNTNRETLRIVLDQVAHPPTGKPVDFRTVAGWDKLDAPTQLYIANLLPALGVGRTSNYLLQVLANYRKSNPIVDCDKVRAAVTRRLLVGH